MSTRSRKKNVKKVEKEYYSERKERDRKLTENLRRKSRGLDWY